jgi:hypothetical protein
MFNAQDFTARAVTEMQTAADLFGAVGGGLQKAIDVAFAATIAANPVLTVDQVSVIIGEVLKAYPSVGPRRSWAVALWKNDDTRRALFQHVGDPSTLTPDTFHAKVCEFTLPLDSRKAYDLAAKAKKTQATALAQTTLGTSKPEVVPHTEAHAPAAIDPVTPLTITACEAVAALLDMALNGDDATRAAARSALVDITNATVAAFDTIEAGGAVEVEKIAA